MLPESWKWRFTATLVVVVLWSLPGMAAKIDRFTDQEGTLHITNAGKEEPVKPETAVAPSPRPGIAPQPSASPPAPPPGVDPRVKPPTPEAGHPGAATPGKRPRPPWRNRGPGRPPGGGPEAGKQ